MPDENTIQFDSPSGPPNPSSKGVLLIVVFILVIVLGGLGTGWFLTKQKTVNQVTGQGQVASAPGVEVKSGGKEIGLNDDKTFRDNAEGVLQKGGIEEDGTHHLDRDGGPSQTAYLTSSVIDLDQFVGKKVQVWGETLGAKKAGWLMDVGRVKELE